MATGGEKTLPLSATNAKEKASPAVYQVRAHTSFSRVCAPMLYVQMTFTLYPTHVQPLAPKLNDTCVCQILEKIFANESDPSLRTCPEDLTVEALQQLPYFASVRLPDHPVVRATL